MVVVVVVGWWQGHAAAHASKRAPMRRVVGCGAAGFPAARTTLPEAVAWPGWRRRRRRAVRGMADRRVNMVEFEVLKL